MKLLALIPIMSFLYVPSLEAQSAKICTVNCLSELIEKRHGIDHRAAKEQTEEVFQAIEEALRQGKRVQIRSFGSFYLQARKAWKARHPKTGKVTNVPARKYPRFRSSDLLKLRINSR